MIQRTPEEIAAELTDVRAARAAFMRGERVSEVQRDGKRMKMADMKLSDFNAAIAELTAEYNGAVAAADGRARRRPTRLAWRN